MMEDIYKIMNDIDDNASLVKETRKLSESHSKISRRTRSLNESLKSLRESYSVKFGLHEKGEEKFADLDSALKYINSQLDKYDHSHLVLYNDGKEMIWLTRYRDENNEDVGFTIGRQNDKSLEFDKNRGLSVKEVDIDDPMIRSSFCKTMQEMGYIKEWGYFGRNMKFAEVKDKPSYIDFKNNVVYYNKDEQIQKSIEKIMDEYHANKNMVKEAVNVLREADEEDAAPTNNDQKDTTAEKSNDSTDNVIDKLRQIGNYETFIKALKSLSAEQKELFRKQFGVVDAIKPSAQKTAIAATKLRPTQSEIDWKKSLSYGLTQDCSYFFKSPVELGMPVLTYKSTFIIDGHHRWSQVFMFNPKADVSCINFNYEQESPTDVLKDFQGAVLATTGNVAVGTAGTNIYSVNEDELRKYILENISDACWQSLVKAKVAEDKNSAVEYLVGNAMILKNKIKPPQNAPDRIDMPQTNNDVVNRAAKALSDMSEEFDDDIDSVLEGFWSNNEESPLGTHELYPETRVRPMEDNVPKWVKDKYGSNARSAWDKMRADDREFNKPIRP